MRDATCSWGKQRFGLWAAENAACSSDMRRLSVRTEERGWIMWYEEGRLQRVGLE